MTTANDIERQIRDRLASEFETDPMPEMIAAIARTRAGKPVTKRDADALMGQKPIRHVRIARRLGWTEIEWCSYHKPEGYEHEVPDWHNAKTMIIAWTERNAVWPTEAELRAKHACYFSAKDERNAERDALLKPRKSGENDPIARAARAIAKIREARAELAAVSDYPSQLHYIVRDMIKE